MSNLVRRSLRVQKRQVDGERFEPHTEDAAKFLDEGGRWQCIRCGACCWFAGLVDERLDRGDGVCKHLGADNLCSVYETRPEYCRVSPDVRASAEASKHAAAMCAVLLEVVSAE